ncbi:PIN domain-containing protein [Candidatus Woesearchaeota archaeon]|nr:PIN domain-containing protein [Candidatus Woesearchaeota archaeon]
MEIKSYFFDTYAFFEIIEGNENYRKYSKDIIMITTKLNLMELHYGLMVEYGKEIADIYYDVLVRFVAEIDDWTIKEANVFRSEYNKRDLSYVDCIGYVIARSKNIRFLTGDKQFEDLENVEFVK